LSTNPPPVISRVPEGHAAVAVVPLKVPSAGAGSLNIAWPLTSINRVKSRAVTLNGLMLLLVTEFFGAVEFIAIAVVPPAIATPRAKVAATFA
jgi:hypothetical protein